MDDYGYAVEGKYKNRWKVMLDYNPKIVGWTPAIYPNIGKAQRLKKKLDKKGLVVDVKEGKMVTKIIPTRIFCVKYTISGKAGSRTYDYKKVKCKK